MNWVSSLVQFFAGLFKWWVTVLPWQAGVRVRLGKHTTDLLPGVHLKIPLVHAVFIQDVRRRRLDMALQTLSTLDGKSATIGANLNYSIIDVRKLYDTLHQGDATLRNMAQSAIAQYVTTHVAADCTPQAIQDSVKIDYAEYGLGEARVYVTDLVVVRTYRLIQDGRWFESALDTHTATNEKK